MVKSTGAATRRPIVAATPSTVRRPPYPAPVPTTPDQRSLGLDTGLPYPPDDLRPMLPRVARVLPVDDAHMVDPTWGGLRVLAAVRGGSVSLLVDGLDVAERFPGLVAALAGLDLSSALLDGEIVVPGARGRSLADAIRRRGEPIVPASLVISDLPWLAGRALVAEPLDRRRDRLAGLAIAAPHLVALAPAAGASAVLEVATLHGLAGIVAKRADSPYLPGVRSRLWTFVRVGDVSIAAPDAPGSGTSHGSRPDIVLLRTLPLGEDA
jgi:bifunctional non-homologous end joining protein LigD